MWWCLIFDFTFSIFACFSLLLFCFQFPSFFFFLFFSRFCAPHYMCYSWIIYVSASHDSWPKNNSFSLFLSFFPVLCRFCCLSHANLNRDRHRVRMNISSNRIGCRSPSSVLPDWSPVGGNKPNEGVAQLSWSVTDHREVSVWFEDLQIFRLSYLSLSLSLSRSQFSC